MDSTVLVLAAMMFFKPVTPVPLDMPVDVLRVEVSDESGNPIPSARVSVGRVRDAKFVVGGGSVILKTDLDGRTRFSNLFEGVHVVAVKAPGFCPERVEVRIVSGIVRKPRVGDLPVVLKAPGANGCQ